MSKSELQEEREALNKEYERQFNQLRALKRSRGGSVEEMLRAMIDYAITSLESTMEDTQRDSMDLMSELGEEGDLEDNEP